MVFQQVIQQARIDSLVNSQRIFKIVSRSHSAEKLL